MIININCIEQDYEEKGKHFIYLNTNLGRHQQSHQLSQSTLQQESQRGFRLCGYQEVKQMDTCLLPSRAYVQSLSQ